MDNKPLEDKNSSIGNKSFSLTLKYSEFFFDYFYQGGLEIYGVDRVYYTSYEIPDYTEANNADVCIRIR